MTVKRIQGKTLESVTKELLGHLVPDTKDKRFLNEITTREVVKATYRVNELPRNSSDANILVPQSLYECKINQVWRYPPLISANFLVRKPEQKIRLEVEGGFFMPRFLLYGEYRRYGNTIQKRYLGPGWQIGTPDGFSKVCLDGDDCDLQEQRAFRATSAPLSYHVWKIEVELDPDKRGEVCNEFKSIPEETVLVKVFDEKSGQESTAISKSGELTHSLDFETIKKREEQEPRIAFIELVSGPISFRVIINVRDEPGSNGEYLRLAVKLQNVQQYKASRPRDLDWRRLSLVSPYMLINIQGSELKMPPQQHVEVLEESLQNDLDEDKDEYLYAYNCVNCVLTRSIKNRQALICTMFGAFDTAREDPIVGPELEGLIANEDSLISQTYTLSDAQKQELLKDSRFINNILAVLKSLRESGQIETHLYKFQWEAIQHRVQILLGGKFGFTTVIKAPTGAGKTAIFMADAALHSLYTGERSVMAFPTRILNEDMFKRLTRFIHALRKNTDTNITGGIFIGQSDPLYKAVTFPKEGQPMIQYGPCPQCNRSTLIAKKQGNRMIGECPQCGHQVDYMYNPGEAAHYLPTITIATPDKLFYEATVRGYESQPYSCLPFFGGSYVKCKNCGYAVSLVDQSERSIECPICKSPVLIRHQDVENSPIGYFVFDEVHSLYGLTGILLSIFLKTLTVMYNKIRGHRYLKYGLKWKPTFETGTATIANEIELLTAITRAEEDKILPFPSNENYNDYFRLDPTRVRYRVVALLPVAKASRTTISNALLQTYIDYHVNGWKQNLNAHLPSYAKPEHVNSYDFILGYLYKKSDGYTLRRTLRDLGRQVLGQSLKVEFLSGDSPTGQVARIFDAAQSGQIKILLANLVISLGIDIRNLNHLIMMGVTKSMIEHIQTVGRTGRGEMPGHVTIHLLPSNPRDMFLFEKFHILLSDVTGYFDRLPIQPTNAYAVQLILPNVVKALLAAEMYHEPSLSYLTASSASRYFGDPYTIRGKKIGQMRINRLLADIQAAMTENSTAPAIRKEIFRIVQNGLRDYLLKWSKLSGSGHYLSSWFQDQAMSLTSLRAQTGREIDISINDVELFHLIEEQERLPSIGRSGTYEEEATEELYSDMGED